MSNFTAYCVIENSLTTNDKQGYSFFKTRKCSFHPLLKYFNM
jgi:hypothetical protein